MAREEKQEILDFVKFYIILSVVRIAVLCAYIGISECTIQQWNIVGIDDKRKDAEKRVDRKLSDQEREKPIRFIMYSSKKKPADYSRRLHVLPNEAHSSQSRNGTRQGSSLIRKRVPNYFGCSSIS